MQHKIDLKDSSKGQKIVAALYLLTQHLPVHDPIRTTIRSHAVSLLDPSADNTVCATSIANLLATARFAGIMSEQNVSIVTKELVSFTHHKTSSSELFGTLFETPSGYERPSMTSARQTSFISHSTVSYSKKPDISAENKNKRQDQILSFINERKSVAIKDIAGLFPEVSEKTIQRELGTLVETGRITKRGSKRWSIYLALPISA